MGLPVKDQMKYWGVAIAVLFALLWVLGDVILPFVISGALAYFLDPVADRLERMGFSRVMATSTITFVAGLVFMLVTLQVMPQLLGQLGELIEAAPELAGKLHKGLTEKFPALLDSKSQLSQSLDSIADTLQSKGGALLNKVLSSAAGIVNVVMLVVLVPVISFYLLMDWDRMVAKVDALLPRDHAPVIRDLASQIDRTLSAFIRGQGTVCLILGAFYAIALMLVGLKFGLIAGAIAGLLSFIPYIGALVGGVLSIGLAIFQFWGSIETIDAGTVVHATNWVRIALVAGVFGLGQFLEGNILSPKLVGGSVGLHPVWLIFSLSAFGSLFGFVGMLVAVPVAASIGVIVRFALLRYQDSRLYRGVEKPTPVDEETED